MAGHSKWANIKHRKAAQDKKRGKLWTKIIKELTIAARDGGPDPDTNPALRLCIQNAKGANMPKDTMERAIKKGSGAEAANLQVLTYEGYAPHGVAIFIECGTDNLNRTVASIRSTFNKNNGTLGTNGSLNFIFSSKGVFTINNSTMEGQDKEELELNIIDGGAEDFDFGDEVITIYTSYDDFGNMQNHLQSLNIEVASAEIQKIPTTSKKLPLKEAQEVLSIIEKFEENEDVNTVYHNLELTDELIDKISNEN